MKIFETFGFLLQYICSPRTTGAVCPSSRFLARKMASGVDDSCSGGVIVELGSGTGAITSAIAASPHCRDCRLYCIEFNPDLCDCLRRKFPSAKILNGSAENIRELVGEDSKNIRAIISGLPLLSLPQDVVKNILDEVEASLPSGGRFVQYTYNLKRNPDSLGFKTLGHFKHSCVYLNIPPARVDVFVKK